MYPLQDRQIDFILRDIHARGIRLESLQFDLVDHICVIIEQKLEKEEDFEKCYRETVKSFYQEQLREIEDETLMILSRRNRLVLSRNQFFVLLFTVFIGPFVSYDLVWLLTSGPAAGWNIPLHIWGATLVYSLFPLLTLLVLLLTPDKFDPLIPARSKVLLGIRPFIKIIPDHTELPEIMRVK